MTTLRRSSIILGLVAAAGLLVPAAAMAADSAPYVDSWSQVPAAVTSAQTVWELTNTAKLDLHSTTGIASEKCTGQDGYIVSALYGEKYNKEISVNEQPTASCADKGYTYYGVVKTITIPNAKVEILAQCGIDPKTNKPLASWSAGPKPCSAKDLNRVPGAIHLTQTSKTKAASMSNVWIDTTGLKLGQLMHIAKGLQPLN
jgi:hypothetical protein